MRGLVLGAAVGAVAMSAECVTEEDIAAFSATLIAVSTCVGPLGGSPGTGGSGSGSLAGGSGSGSLAGGSGSLDGGSGSGSGSDGDNYVNPETCETATTCVDNVVDPGCTVNGLSLDLYKEAALVACEPCMLSFASFDDCTIEDDENLTEAECECISSIPVPTCDLPQWVIEIAEANGDPAPDTAELSTAMNLLKDVCAAEHGGETSDLCMLAIATHQETMEAECGTGDEDPVADDCECLLSISVPDCTTTIDDGTIDYADQITAFATNLCGSDATIKTYDPVTESPDLISSAASFGVLGALFALASAILL